ncbi:MAG: glycosyltransferase family 2 protein [Chthoniobacterales bacterium]|nr:glycosyltransferase family 2 protein [Chthoniobacterales bacterium]
MKYVLITAARNEAAFIEKTLTSAVAQTVAPERWFIVDDGSTDRTAEIVESFARRFAWIELIRRPRRPDRSFAGKVYSFEAGWAAAQAFDFDVVGNLDADISFEPDHFEFLLRQLSSDPSLGVVGTPFTEAGYDSAEDSFEGERHVAGQCQLFRRECFQDIGGYVPNPAGGVDWIAVTTARMKGWRTRSFPEKRYHHYRPMGTAEKGGVGALFSYGEKDYYLGGSPLWQLFRVCYRSTKRPFLVGGITLLAGYSWAALRRVERPVSPELMRFHRREQMLKLRGIFRALLSRRKIDNFRVATGQ